MIHMSHRSQADQNERDIRGLVQAIAQLAARVADLEKQARDTQTQKKEGAE